MAGTKGVELVTDKASKGSLLGVELSDVERREVLEDLFVFGKENQRSFLYRMAVLLLLLMVQQLPTILI